MNLYTIHSGDEFGGDECYSVLKGPNGFECWLTEPEDRSWHRDGNEAVQRLEQLEQQLTASTAKLEEMTADYDAACHLANSTSEAWKAAKARCAELEEELDQLRMFGTNNRIG